MAKFDSHSVDTGPVDGGAVDLSALEEQIRTAPAERPPVTRLISTRQTDADLAAAFKLRMLANLGEQALILDDMKLEGPFSCNFTWGVDATGRHFIASIQIMRIYA